MLLAIVLAYHEFLIIEWHRRCPESGGRRRRYQAGTSSNDLASYIWFEGKKAVSVSIPDGGVSDTRATTAGVLPVRAGIVRRKGLFK